MVSPTIAPPLLFDEAFKALYGNLGFMDAGGPCHPLYSTCQRAPECWRTVKAVHRPPPGNCEAHIFRPWVGPRYQDSRLLVVGLNMNGWGGYDAFHRREGIPHAKTELEVKSKLFRNPKYAGSLFEVRMLACAWAVLRTAGLETPFNSFQELEITARSVNATQRRQFIEGYDLIAFTNLVKCGPAPCYPKDVKCGGTSCNEHRNGAPTQEMIMACPSHVLSKEILILNPKVILTLGKAAFAGVSGIRGKSDWKHFTALHPAARGYRLIEVLNRLANVSSY